MSVRRDPYDPIALKDLDDDPELFDHVEGDNGNMSGPTIVEDLIKRRDTPFTPDLTALKMEEYHAVFVYGTLKSGGRLTHLLDGCPFIGDGYIIARNYNLLCTTREGAETGGFPVLKFVDNSHPMAGKVLGEVYIVDTPRLMALDRVEQNGVMYNRKKFWVKCADQSHLPTIKQAVKCWTYLGNDSFWRSHRLYQLEPEYHQTQQNETITMHNFYPVPHRKAA